MQVTKVGVSDQHIIDGRQVFDAVARNEQPLQYEQPLREIGIDDDILSADLQEKSGVSNESDGEVFAVDQHRFAGLAGAASPRRMADQSSKLTRLVLERDIEHRPVVIRRVRAERVATFYIVSCLWNF